MEDPAEFDRVAAMLPVVADREALRNDLIATSYWLAWGTYERRRADPKAVHAALEGIHIRLRSALEALENCGHDAQEALARRAEVQGARSLRDCGKGGRRRLEDGLRGLADLLHWAAEARANVDVPREIVYEPDPDDPGGVPTVHKPGRPKDQPAETAMQNLVSIWERQTDKRPTITTDRVEGSKFGSFLAFSSAVIDPIYRSQGLVSPDIPALARKVLYPPTRAKA
jgi:hypothetical protein